MADDDVPKIKIVVVGDGAVGKTCLLISWTEDRFPEDYVPTVFDNMKKVSEVDGREVAFNLWDTAGQEGYERLRILSYPGTDLFMLCYAVNKVASLKNAKSHWWPEIAHHCPDGKFLLVGTKADLRGEGESVDAAMVQEAVDHIGAVKAVECSAKAGTGVRDVFEEAARCVLGVTVPAVKSRGGKKCTLL